ncbi:hypothetical protein OH686_22500 [Pseudomonas sp. SO81]|nr:hypothetical protein OH686_22500 [Pseudomonas sp. SO81]
MLTPRTTAGQPISLIERANRKGRGIRRGRPAGENSAAGTAATNGCEASAAVPKAWLGQRLRLERCSWRHLMNEEGPLPNPLPLNGRGDSSAS